MSQKSPGWTDWRVPQNPERGVRVLNLLEGAGQDAERRRVLSPNVDRVGQPAQVVAHVGDGLAPGRPDPVPQRLRVDAARDGHQPLPAGDIRFARPGAGREAQSSSAAARTTASAGRALSRSIDVSTGNSSTSTPYSRKARA